jgi:hypothetical protein
MESKVGFWTFMLAAILVGIATALGTKIVDKVWP